MDEPRTSAGRALLVFGDGTYSDYHASECDGLIGQPCTCDLPSRILAIEAEASTEPGALREALRRLEAEPTMNIVTGNGAALFDKAKASRTQEVTVSAQALVVLIPAIEHEARTQVFRVLRAALSREEATSE